MEGDEPRLYQQGVTEREYESESDSDFRRKRKGNRGVSPGMKEQALIKTQLSLSQLKEELY